MIENKQYKTSESGRKAQKKYDAINYKMVSVKMKKDNAIALDEYIKNNHIASKNSFIIELINEKINYKKGEKKMDKIKATELFNELVKASQKAYTSEDKNIKKRLLDIITTEKNIDNKILKISECTSEYNRFSLIKTIIEVLENYNLIENDLDILIKKQCDDIIVNALDEIDFNEIKSKI